MSLGVSVAILVKRERPQEDDRGAGGAEDHRQLQETARLEIADRLVAHLHPVPSPPSVADGDEERKADRHAVGSEAMICAGERDRIHDGDEKEKWNLL